MISFEEAKELVGQQFSTTAQDGRELNLTLILAQALPRSGRPAQFRDPYTLHFKGTPGYRCFPTIYALRHPALGSREVTLMAIAHDPADDEYTYEALYN